MLSDKRSTIKQDLADVKGSIEENIIGCESLSELKDKFEKLQGDLLDYLERVDNALVDLR